jgi:hypothetical protein
VESLFKEKLAVIAREERQNLEEQSVYLVESEGLNNFFIEARGIVQI